jgi:hypothetical protein
MPRWVYLNSPSISLPHSYFPQLREGLPFYAADAPGDTLFPDHLLTQVRAALARIVPTVRLDSKFKRCRRTQDVSIRINQQ